MIRLTNLADYAVLLMSELSLSNTRVSAQDLGAKTGLPIPTVSKLLNALTKSGLLLSHRGLKGGFALAREAADISATEIIEVIDGPIALTNCLVPGDQVCSYDGYCQMRPRWSVVNEKVREALSEVSLADLAADQQRAPDRVENSDAAKSAVAV